MAADALDDVHENRAHLLSRRRLAFAQDHRHRFAAGAFVDVDGQETALVVMGIEQRELLIAVNRVERVVDVQRDRARRAPVAVAELVHHRRHQPRDPDPRRRVLQPRHGGLRA